MGVQAISRGRPAHARSGAALKVLFEDLRLDPDALGLGALDGAVATDGGITLAPGRARGLYTSPALTATRNPFTHVGLHWRADAAPALSFEVRWSVDGASWSGWEPVLIESHVPAGARGETFGALVTVDRATRVQLRTVFGGGQLRPLLRAVTVTLLNARDGPPVPSLAGAPATPVLSTGTVYAREGWGADESLRFDGAGNEIWPRMYVPVKKAVVHHTATTNSYKTVEDAKAEVRAIYAYHAVTLGWGDGGYNEIVDKWGNVYEMRHGRGSGGSREVLSPGVVAGHALDHNYGSAGVALLGTFTKAGEGGKPGIAPPNAMKAALAEVLAWECDRHDADPQGSSDFLLFSDGWTRGLKNIPGHRDCNPTICPGGHVYELLPSLRSEVATKVARGAPSATLFPPSVDTAPVGSVAAVPFSWGSEGGSGLYLHLLEGWRRQAPGSEAIDYLSGFDAAKYPFWLQTEQTSSTFGELFDAFSALAAPAAGHYTFHVLAKDASDRVSYHKEHTLLVTAGGNGPPSVAITSPSDGSAFAFGASVLFEGSAADPEDGVLTSSIAWTSSIDGPIGSGGSFARSDLSAGDHVITASVTDSGGALGSASVTIRVLAPPAGFTLSARGFKVQGLQKAELRWYGAASATVRVWRSDNGGPWTDRGTIDNDASATEAAPNTHVDAIDRRGGGTYTYKLSEVGTEPPRRSNESTVTF